MPACKCDFLLCKDYLKIYIYKPSLKKISSSKRKPSSKATCIAASAKKSSRSQLAETPGGCSCSALGFVFHFYTSAPRIFQIWVCFCGRVGFWEQVVSPVECARVLNLSISCSSGSPWGESFLLLTFHIGFEIPLFWLYLRGNIFW